MENSDLWASLPIPTLVLSADDVVLDINPAAELFLNASAKSMRGDPIWDRVLVDTALDSAFARVRRDNAQLFINNVDVSTGTTTPLKCNIQIAPYGDPVCAWVLIEPRHMAERIGRGEAVKSAVKTAIGMADMLAHEIKNPLAGITGAAQLLSMNLKPEDQELTDLIVEESRRIVQLLDQVEQFGNLRPPDRAAVNIHDLLDRARKSASVGFAANMTIEDDFDPSLPPVFVDADQILQVISNLLKNASEAAGPKGGTIRLRTYFDVGIQLRRRDGSGNRLPLQLEIIDDGPGFPPDLINDAFEPFISGKENGTGLGLALVSKIINEHDGWIDVDSVPGKTVFRISLPIAPKNEAN